MVLGSPSNRISISSLKREFGVNWLKRFDLFLIRVPTRSLWQNRAHFFAIAAHLMRSILVDHARSHAYAKRGGGARKITLDEALAVSQQRAADVVALDDALKRLAEIDRQQSRIVELKFFGGLTIEETAEALGLSPAP